MRWWRVSRAVCLLLAAWLAVGPFEHAWAQSSDAARAVSSTLVIFDGSGSMWGKLDGEKQTKLVQAREAVRAALSKADPAATNVGLLSYGHRRAADCSDVQLLVPLEPSNAANFSERINWPLEKLNPKGKGPLTAALKEAAKIIGKAPPGPRSLVLVHDDPDNCQQDACAALAELQQAAPGVVIHTVGLGLKEGDAARYQCLTKATGGRTVDAQNGDAISSGLADVLAVAFEGRRDGETPKQPPASTVAKAASPTPVAAVAAPLKAPALSSDGAPRLVLRALMTKDIAVEGHRVRWSITPDGRGEGGGALVAAEGVTATVPLAYGSYRVRAEVGAVFAERAVSVGAQGESLADVIFEAAELRLSAPLASDASVLISRQASQDNPKALRAPLALWPHGQTALLVPAGPLLLQIEQAELRTERSIDVTAGRRISLDVAQAGGRIVLDLMAPVGPPPGTTAQSRMPPVFVVTEDDPDAPRGRRELARSSAPSAEFVVAPGTYIVSASRDGLEVRERVTVAAGDVVRRSLPLVAARLVLGARLAGAADAAGAASDMFKLVRLDQADAPALVFSGPAVIADIPPGKYRVDGRRNAAAIAAHQEFEIKAGEYKAITLDYQAGALRLEPSLKGDAGAQGLSWVVAGADGHLVWSSRDASPTVFLGAGRYVVRLGLRSAYFETPVEIRTGEILTLRLGQP